MKYLLLLTILLSCGWKGDPAPKPKYIPRYFESYSYNYDFSKIANKTVVWVDNGRVNGSYGFTIHFTDSTCLIVKANKYVINILEPNPEWDRVIYK